MMATDNAVWDEVVRRKRVYLDEFSYYDSRRREESGESMNFNEFCSLKCKDSKMSDEQLIVACTLADLGIGIGRLQVLSEVEGKGIMLTMGRYRGSSS
jgi:hypothetical protein